MKLAGSVLVLGASALFWFLRMRERRRRRETLRDLISALGRMSEELRMARPPMPWLLERTAENCGPAAEFFRRSAEALRQEASWQEAIACLPLSREETRVLEELRHGLRGDEEAVCAALRHAAGRLSRVVEELEGRRQSEERQLTAVCFSGGLLLVILLI